MEGAAAEGEQPKTENVVQETTAGEKGIYILLDVLPLWLLHILSNTRLSTLCHSSVRELSDYKGSGQVKATRRIFSCLVAAGRAIFSYYPPAVIKPLAKFNKIFPALALFLLLPSAEAAPALLRIASIGQPAAATTAGSLGYAISCLVQGPPVGITLYWTLYALWAFSAMSVIAFTCFWVTPKKRLEYLCLFVVMVGIYLAVLVAASASVPDKIPERLETWSPIITVLCAGAPALAFDRHDPEAKRRGQDSGTGNGSV